jgi:predicted ATPase
VTRHSDGDGGLAASERFDEALAVIEEAIARAEQNRESFFSLAEFWRIKGEILLSAAASNVSAADGRFLQAIEQARRQGALSWELRAATSLARPASGRTGSTRRGAF